MVVEFMKPRKKTRQTKPEGKLCNLRIIELAEKDENVKASVAEEVTKKTARSQQRLLWQKPSACFAQNLQYAENAVGSCGTLCEHRKT